MLRTLLKKIIRRLSRTTVSVIICSIDDAKFKRVAANYTQMLAGTAHELIRIDDARSLAEGYNRGIALSRGEYLIFSHDDIEIVSSDFRDRLLLHLAEFDLVGVAGTSKVIDGKWGSAGQPAIHGQVVHPADNGPGLTYELYGQQSDGIVCEGIKALDGLFIAARRHAAEAVRFDDESFDGFHGYDVDFTYRAYLAGFQIAVCYDMLIYHQSLGKLDEKWQHYMQVFARKFAGKVSMDPPGQRICWNLSCASKEEARTAYEMRLREVTAAGTSSSMEQHRQNPPHADRPRFVR